MSYSSGWFFSLFLSTLLSRTTFYISLQRL